jgi:hypothetical protein
MYPFFLSIHSILRWLVVIFAILALVRAYRGWIAKTEWVKMDDRAGLLFTSTIDLQVLVGLILYLFLSPITRTAFGNLANATSDRVLGYFTFDHIVIMLIAMALAHVGRAVSKKATLAQAKFRAAAIWFSLSALAILIGIPWPFIGESIGRPLLRLFS